MAAYPFSRGKRNFQRRNKNYIRKNERIRCPEIRVIGPSGKMIGVMNPRDALKLAKEAGLDLVEVSPTARPPVCRILDFGKYKYELSKKKKDTTKAVTRLKEVKFRVSTGQHDYETKLRRAEQFLGHGHKVKLTLTYPASTGRNFDEILRVIDSLQLTANHKVATPANWQDGDDCIVVPALSDDEAKELFPKGFEAQKPYLRVTPQPNR